MPSSRKRIGFLPKTEIQDLINKLCAKTNSSQSKVTGYLVEEALIARGLLDNKESLVNNNIDKGNYTNDSLSGSANNEEIPSNDDAMISGTFNSQSQSSLEYKLLKDYLEFKRFKRMLKVIKEEENDKCDI